MHVYLNALLPKVSHPTLCWYYVCSSRKIVFACEKELPEIFLHFIIHMFQGFSRKFDRLIIFSRPHASKMFPTRIGAWASSFLFRFDEHIAHFQQLSSKESVLESILESMQHGLGPDRPG